MSIRWCNGCGSYHLHGQHTTASPFRPAAPVVQGADELRVKLAEYLSGSTYMWDTHVDPGYQAQYLREADALLSGPLARLLAERDQAQAELAERVAQVRRVRELYAPDDGLMGELRCRGCATHVTFTRWPCKTIRALDGKP